ncbi:hypothetical protein BGZ51_000109 [Haplosporangium sp. Z 767]|nr:hypothetical protein BGZ50_009134 [Haplosporangium sp. Z 11]KAF9194357.1 hypothetical protein BGZ51_000109 [Haplosporangium sp. Z 767]
MFLRFLSVIFSLCLLASNCLGDSIEITSPRPHSKHALGESVTYTYTVYHNGLAKLIWVKAHLMTEDGYDAGLGVISAVSRSEWQDSKSVSSHFQIPDTLKTGKYNLHFYGSTEQPCAGERQGSIDTKCEGILSEMLPIEIIARTAVKSDKAGIQLRKRSLYTGRDLGVHGRSEFVLADGSMDTKKMLYLFSLI